MRYCRAGQNSKKSYLGHGLGMIIDQDILGCGLVIFLECFSCVNSLSAKSVLAGEKLVATYLIST